MHIQKLSWAGIKVTAAKTSLAIDALLHVEQVKPLMGKPAGSMFAIDTTKRIDLALITHVHPDHYDPALLKAWLKTGGKVLCPAGIVAKIIRDGFSATGLSFYESIAIQGMTVTAVPASDGFGDDQVSWVVQAGGKRIIHCGDTLWHGHWWRIAKDHGPFDAAFLPICGGITRYPLLAPSGIPMCMTPAQAAAAAGILAPNVAVPIHYGRFNHPLLYKEFPAAEQVFVREAENRHLVVRKMHAGEYLRI